MAENGLISDKDYRAPAELELSGDGLRRAILIGSHLLAAYPKQFGLLGCPTDFFMLGENALPTQPPAAPDDYSFQVVQIPLRTLVTDHDYIRLPHDDLRAYRALFDKCLDRLRATLDETLKWNRSYSIPTFVWNFLVPQQNLLGRLQPRCDLRNAVYFVEKLNEALGKMLEHYQRCYIFDFDSIVASLGRRYYHADAVWPLNHGVPLTDADYEYDSKEREPSRASDAFQSKGMAVVNAAVSEMRSMYRAFSEIDKVELVIFGGDHTLWRGALSQGDEAGKATAVRGWPLGLAETVHFLRGRGIATALICDGPGNRLESIWAEIYDRRLSAEDFTAVRADQPSAVDTIGDVLSDLDIRPQSAVLVHHDEQVREDAEARYPGIRTLGRNPLLWRRALLWSAETQCHRGDENAYEDPVVAATLGGNDRRESRARFLRSLQLRARVFEVSRQNDHDYRSALAVLSNAPMFNTTGEAWSDQRCDALLCSGGRIFAFEAQDRFANYGIVGVAVTEGNQILQLALSSRVVGIDLELAFVSEVTRVLFESTTEKVLAHTAQSPSNVLSRDVFARAGFTLHDGIWSCARPGNSGPLHIAVVNDALKGVLV